MLKRIELNIATGIQREIPQQAYRNGEEVIVLDSQIKPPKGYEPFDPEEVKTADKKDAK